MPYHLKGENENNLETILDDVKQSQQSKKIDRYNVIKRNQADNLKSRIAIIAIQATTIANNPDIGEGRY